MLWEKIDRESEWTWRYEVFRDNIMEYLPKEEVDECKHRFINTNHLCTYCWEQVFTETKKIELLQDHIMIDKDIARVLLPVEKKVNEIINTLNTLIK